MMPNRHEDTESDARHRVAQKYRHLGYEVQENPGGDVLPDFMRGVSPDILARSEFDNVVVEIKDRSALKGSNNLVSIAERIAERPEWRFELVMIEKNEPSRPTTNYPKILEYIEAAISIGLYEPAYIYLVAILVGQIRDLARVHKIRVNQKSDQALLVDLSFNGVIPEQLIEKCFSVLATRNKLAHTFDDKEKPTEDALKELFDLCRQLRELV